MAVEIQEGYNRPDMELVLHSVNYHDCPVELREKVSFSESQQHDIIGALIDQKGIAEAAILQTCNRTEIYLYAKKNTDWRQTTGKLIAQFNPEAQQIWEKY